MTHHPCSVSTSSSQGKTLPFPFVTLEPKFDDKKALVELVSHSKMARHSAIISMTNDRLKTVEDSTVSTSVSHLAVAFRSQNIGKMELPYRSSKPLRFIENQKQIQIDMPDIKLLSGSLSLLPSSNAKRSSHTIAWMIDSTKDLWYALASESCTAIISNTPVDMLEALQRAHKEMC